MARYLKNTVVLAELETVYGSDPVPLPGTNAILVSDVNIVPLQAANVDRDLVRGFFGASEQLVGTFSVGVSFTVEMAGSGVATTAPKWGPLLQACGFAGASETASYTYTPVSTFGAASSVTIYYYLDGQLHKLLGARGTFTIDMGVGNRPVMKFSFTGLDGGLTAVANPTTTLTGFKAPKVVTNANSADIVFGSVTYTTSTGTVSGGTAYNSRGLMIDIGNEVVFQPMLGVQTVEVVNRTVTGDVSLDLTAAAAITFMTAVKEDTLIGFGFTHGTTAGNIIVIHAPAVQRIDPTVEPLNAQALHAYKLRFTPVTGNDEIRITTR